MQEWVFVKGRGKHLKASMWIYVGEGSEFFIDNMKVKKLSWFSKLLKRMGPACQNGSQSQPSCESS